MFFCCECSVMSCRGFCDGLITPSEESYRLWYAVVCDLENLWMRRAWPTGGGGCWGVGCRAKNKQTKCWLYYLTKLLITVKCNRKFNDIITHTSRQGWGFSAPVQTGPWPTKPALKWVPSFFFWGGGVTWPGMSLNTHPHLVVRLKKEYRYTSTLLMGLHGLF